jgi:C-1 hydroxylase
LAGWRISVLELGSTERPEEPTMSTAANKSVVRAFVEAWNERDLDRFDDLMAEGCRLTVGGDHQLQPGGDPGDREHWLAGFPDYRFTLLDLIAEGDKVLARMPFSGTQTGPVLDLAASGRSVQVSEIVGGKIVEAWEEYDEFGMRRQLGVLPQTGVGSEAPPSPSPVQNPVHGPRAPHPCEGSNLGQA